MKYTLLELVQSIASSLDSDEVNSIDDSVESQQIVEVIKSTYYDIVSRANLPEHSTLFNLTASGDNTKPVLMYVPTDVEKVEWIKYNKIVDGGTDPVYDFVTFLPLPQFLASMHSLQPSATEVDSFTQTIDSSSVIFYYSNDHAPEFYTSVDDHMLIFDSYDSDVDTTLTSSKSLGYGRKNLVWAESNTFTPDLDESQFALLLNEAKALAWAELKQTSHQKAEVNAKRQWIASQRSRNRTDPRPDFYRLPYYGRK